MTVKHLITYLLEFNLDADIKLLDNYIPTDFNVSWINGDGDDANEPWTPELVRKSKFEATTVYLSPESSSEKES